MDNFQQLINDAILCKIEESEILEFKSHFQHPNPDSLRIEEKGRQVFQINRKIAFDNIKHLQEYFQFQCIKVVASFLNSSGGNLIIGISDNSGQKATRDIYNITKEGETLDEFQLRLSTILEQKLTRKIFSRFISVKILPAGTKHVALIEVKKLEGRQKAVFIDTFDPNRQSQRKSLFFRPSNQTVEINDPEQI